MKYLFILLMSVNTYALTIKTKDGQKYEVEQVVKYSAVGVRIKTKDGKNKFLSKNSLTGESKKKVKKFIDLKNGTSNQPEKNEYNFFNEMNKRCGPKTPVGKLINKICSDYDNKKWIMDAILSSGRAARLHYPDMKLSFYLNILPASPYEKVVDHLEFYVYNPNYTRNRIVFQQAVSKIIEDVIQYTDISKEGTKNLKGLISIIQPFISEKEVVTSWFSIIEATGGLSEFKKIVDKLKDRNSTVIYKIPRYGIKLDKKWNLITMVTYNGRDKPIGLSKYPLLALIITKHRECTEALEDNDGNDWPLVDFFKIGKEE